MAEINFSKTQIQNYLVNRSFLHKKASSIHPIFDQYKCIQVDVMDIVGRSHELSLWNRVEEIKQSDIYNYLYKDKLLFEYWFQLYSIIPAKYYPYFNFRRNAGLKWRSDYEDLHKKEASLVLKFIHDNPGGISSKELTHIPQTKSLLSWTSATSQTAVLEYLWDKGEIMISHRKGNRKYYDLTERVLSDNILAEKTSINKSLEFILDSYFGYFGILRTAMLSRVGYMQSGKLREVFKNKLEKGEIIKLTIDNKATSYYILTRQANMIEKLSSGNLHTELNILPPLDPLVLDRKILSEIFNFQYTWEAYVPALKRKFGHYGMPLLYKGHFIGQVDLFRNKVSGIVEIRKLEIRNNEALKSEMKNINKLLKEQIASLENFLTAKHE